MTTGKIAARYEGFGYIHLCDIDRRDSLKHEKAIHEKMQETTKKMRRGDLVKYTHYISKERPLDETTTQLLKTLWLASVTGEPTTIVMIDESLANAFEWVGRLRYGAVIIHEAKYITKEALINTTSKYVDLSIKGQYSENQASRGHETIQIVRADFFKFDLETAITETRSTYRYAPCRWLPVRFQLWTKGDIKLLAQAFEEPTPDFIAQVPTSTYKRAYKIPEVLSFIKKFDTTLNRTDVTRLLSRNTQTKEIIKNQFSL